MESLLAILGVYALFFLVGLICVTILHINIKAHTKKIENILNAIESIHNNVVTRDILVNTRIDGEIDRNNKIINAIADDSYIKTNAIQELQKKVKKTSTIKN